MAWNNYDDVLGQLLDAGLEVRDLQVGTANAVRCRVNGGGPEKRGWYWLSDIQLERPGTSIRDPYIVGSFGIWHGNDSGKQKLKLTGATISDDERKAIAARHRENAERVKVIREATAKKAAARAAAVWSEYVQHGSCDYLERKGVQAHGVRFHPGGIGTFLVPMSDDKGQIWGLQIIRGSDRDPKKREKDYWPAGMSKIGHYHLIGSPVGVLLIAEGYATAATLRESTGLPVAVAFDANNLLPVAQALHKSYPTVRLLLCADDDYLTEGNPGVSAAQAAALAVNGAYVAPAFPADREGKKLTDFNDLAHFPSGGTHLVARQIEAAIAAAGWVAAAPVSAGTPPKGGGESGRMASLISVEDAVARFWNTYGLGGKVLFDEHERRLVSKDDVMNICPSRSWDLIKSHPKWRTARDTEIGFDPTERDEKILCNLYGGWPTDPVSGKCTALLELLAYLCSNDVNQDEVYSWLLKWLAYPIQHRGAKMHTAPVIHGPQGNGKSRFFEAYAKIFGEYGRVLGQEALEDKFNSDWAEKKLFILADEILARQDMYHIKNRLKGFITGDTIRVNPKNVAAHNERNHMNIVFLSNERQPLVLEGDDRRHMVIWVPPALSDDFFHEVNLEIEQGGIAALHHFLLNLDLGDFKPWTKPPMTKAKRELIDLSRSSEERFLREWIALEIEGADKTVLPFCPCLGSQLYKVYERWCEAHGERKRGLKELINLCGKQPGWVAGESKPTWTDMNNRTTKNRKMVVPSPAAVLDSLKIDRSGKQANVQRDRFGSQAEWLTACFFEFGMAAGLE